MLKKFQDVNQQHSNTGVYPNENFFEASHIPLHNMIMKSEHISPLLKAYEEENGVLKNEVLQLSSDLKRFADMLEMMIEENKYIKEHINGKNKDIGKIIETIGLNDSEMIQEYKQKLHILTEENNILIKHLEEMKVVSFLKVDF